MWQIFWGTSESRSQSCQLWQTTAKAGSFGYELPENLPHPIRPPQTSRLPRHGPVLQSSKRRSNLSQSRWMPIMKKQTRRRFLKGVLIPAALGTLSRRAVQGGEPDGGVDSPPDIIDTNVHLFEWPFRKLKYAGAKALVAKLCRHRITQAWAGSYEGLLHKNIDGVNTRLADECRANGAGILLPFGTVNPALPNWEEDLRRCQEKYRMPGIRLYPSYHNYTLQKPEVARLLEEARKRDLIVQLAVRMEDPRVHLPVTRTPAVDVAELPELLAALPGINVQL